MKNRFYTISRVVFILVLLVIVFFQKVTDLFIWFNSNPIIIGGEVSHHITRNGITSSVSSTITLITLLITLGFIFLLMGVRYKKKVTLEQRNNF